MGRPEFSRSTKQQALTRQKNKCGSCGDTIFTLDQRGKKSLKFGEGAQAHHMIHCQQGGTNTIFNCVIICESCHYSAHEGGNYRNKAMYLMSGPTDYEYFYG